MVKIIDNKTDKLPQLTAGILRECHGAKLPLPHKIGASYVRIVINVTHPRDLYFNHNKKIKCQKKILPLTQKQK